MVKALRIFVFDKDDDGNKIIKNIFEFSIEPGEDSLKSILTKRGKFREPIGSLFKEALRGIAEDVNDSIVIEKVIDGE